jgi:hypothetical protein
MKFFQTVKKADAFVVEHNAHFSVRNCPEPLPSIAFHHLHEKNNGGIEAGGGGG